MVVMTVMQKKKASMKLQFASYTSVVDSNPLLPHSSRAASSEPALAVAAASSSVSAENMDGVSR